MDGPLPLLPSEVSILEYAFGVVVSVLFAIGAWLWGQLLNAVKELRQDIADQNEALDSHRAASAADKLDNERRFAKNEDMKANIERVTNDNKENIERVTSAMTKMQENMQTITVTQASLATNMGNIASSVQHLLNRTGGS